MGKGKFVFKARALLFFFAILLVGLLSPSSRFKCRLKRPQTASISTIMEMGLVSWRPSVSGKSVSFADMSQESEEDEVQKLPSPRRGILKKSSPKRTGVRFPVKKLKFRMLTNYSFSICNDVPVYMAAVLEYLVTEVISCAGEAANARMSNIKPRHLQIVFQNNEELRELMTGEDRSIASMLNEPSSSGD